MNEDKRLNNNDNSTVNNSFILVKDVRNNSDKAHLNKLNDFVDHPFFKFLSPVNDTSGSLIWYIYQAPFMKETWSKYGQLMLMDSTFGLTSCSAKMFSLMIIDGEEISQVCCFFYSKEKTNPYLFYIRYLKPSEN